MTALTAEYVRALLTYEPGTGAFRWNVRRRGIVKGQVAGTTGKHGYRYIMIDGRLYRSSRLAWLITHGRWPDPEVDHRNGKRADDRLRNLREATRAQNLANRGLQKNNTSGFKGVRRSFSGRWRASIWKDGKEYWLGVFDKKREAAAAYAKAAEALHGEFRSAA